MSLRDLTTASMVSVTQAYLDPERERPIFARYPRLGPWLADIEAAHAALHEAQASQPDALPDLAPLNERAAALDAEHDRKARGLFDVIAGLSSLSDDPETAARFRTLQSELFPNGLSIVNRTYLDQAGEASLVESRLSASSWDLLRGTVVSEIPLVKHFEDWRRAAVELGEVESERVRIAKAKKASSIASLGKARLAWIGAVNALLFVIDREKDLTPEDRRRLLEPLETALSKAAAKRKAPAKDAEVVSTDESASS